MQKKSATYSSNRQSFDFRFGCQQLPGAYKDVGKADELHWCTNKSRSENIFHKEGSIVRKEKTTEKINDFWTL
ncbi:hypothetical protein CEXT_91601 [Caerostris extrusa]|uniref:Uncharacterized protein n=1 Tax=Caerostris extrusa TaxID=172846 RepID=A0AAV4Q5V5_CAEEX|nr:hypothetical protein CEXT_91601 [Caerostris extrusa]